MHLCYGSHNISACSWLPFFLLIRTLFFFKPCQFPLLRKLLHDCFIPILPSPFIHTYRNFHVAPVSFYDSPLLCYQIGAILISTFFCPNTVLQRSLTIHSPSFL